jgi:hypothetical protein
LLYLNPTTSSIISSRFMTLDSYGRASSIQTNTQHNQTLYRWLTTKKTRQNQDIFSLILPYVNIWNYYSWFILGVSFFRKFILKYPCALYCATFSDEERFLSQQCCSHNIDFINYEVEVWIWDFILTQQHPQEKKNVTDIILNA